MLKAGSKGMLKITSLEALRECIDNHSNAAEDEDVKKVTEFFDKFFYEIEYLKRVKQFFHKSIYRCLYEFFYDPLLDDSDDDEQQGTKRIYAHTHTQMQYINMVVLEA